jgi:hypothetical protein
VIVDPADPKLKAHFVAQLERKYEQISNFQGLVVDRSDCRGRWSLSCAPLYISFVILHTKQTGDMQMTSPPVPRSDWNSLYNFDFDDGASFVRNETAHLVQYSYLDTIAALREVMVEKQGNRLIPVPLTVLHWGNPLTGLYH